MPSAMSAPLIGEGARAQVTQVLRSIAADLRAAAARATGASLAHGSAGLALVLGELACALPGEGCDDACEELLDHAFEAASSEATGPSLYNGLAGTAFAYLQL